MVIALLFIASVMIASAMGELPYAVPAVYLCASLPAFMMYYKDKRAAGAHQTRTPESTLHTLALLGGWPGALLAQGLLRHKTRKMPFQAVFWCTVALNCLFNVALLRYVPAH